MLKGIKNRTFQDQVLLFNFLCIFLEMRHMAVFIFFKILILAGRIIKPYERLRELRFAVGM